jgi:3-oxo-5-alpha-steroid 4-dehydrogenase 1
MALVEYIALVKQIDFDYLYSGTSHTLINIAILRKDIPAKLTVTKQWLLYGFALLGPLAFAYDAPFGRFATPHSVLSVDGVKSWIVMELVSPLSFLVTAYLHPFSPTTPLLLPSFSSSPAFGIKPPLILTALYLIHYLNRALISPLRSPSRSKSHLVVVACGIAFNLPNGFLLGAYLSSASAAAYLTQNGAPSSPRFWAGLAIWAAGFMGNVYHDEILLNIRRKAIAKGKGQGAAGGERTASASAALCHPARWSVLHCLLPELLLRMGRMGRLCTRCESDS